MSTVNASYVLQKPFQVWVIDGGIHSGFDIQSAAESTAAAGNKEAEVLGLTTRYEVRELDKGEG